MTVFSEHFPNKKDPVERYIERKSDLEEIAAAIKRNEREELVKASLESLASTSSHPLMLKSRMSMSETIDRMKRDTTAQLRLSKEIDDKLEKIEKDLETFDGIALSHAEDQVDVDNVESSSSECRVHQIEDLSCQDEDKSADLWIPYETQKNMKVREIRPTRASLLRSEFIKSKTEHEQQALQAYTPTSQKGKKPTSKNTKTKSARKGLNENKYVRKILIDAVEKHKAVYLMRGRNYIPINKIELQLIKND